MPPPVPDFRPRLRPEVAAVPAKTFGHVTLLDPRRIARGQLTLARHALNLVKLFDGSLTVREIQLASLAATGGVFVSLEQVGELVQALDDALFLDSPAFREFLHGPVRPPACIGCYPEDPADIRALFRDLFVGRGGPGLPAANPAPSPHGRLRAALLPHMDYARGGVTYGWGFRELIEQTDARLFVVVATSHYSSHRFTLTRRNFSSPLGVVETDAAYVDRIADAYGDAVFDDPYAHVPEHSIELEVVLLQYLLEKREPFRIVPLLVGSFGDCVDRQTSPAAFEDVSRMVSALRSAEAAAGEPVCYLISGDLAHIGPKFDDPDPVNAAWLAESRTQDQKILDRLNAADPAGYFRTIADENDARRICGLPPTWLTLEVLKPRTGRVLHYNRYVHPHGHESVSFAAAAFYE